MGTAAATMAKRSTQSDEALPTEGGSQPESSKYTTPCFRRSPDSTLLSTSKKATTMYNKELRPNIVAI